jgi:hypothetical protein
MRGAVERSRERREARFGCGGVREDEGRREEGDRRG